MTLMYLLNGQNWEWFVCLAAMPLILYHLTDLRIATLGIASAWIIGLTCEKMGFLSFSNATSIGANHTLIFLFCWISAVSLRVSAASIKRAETIKTHETIAFIAHEMRTPISSVSLIAQTLRSAGELDATRTAAIAKTLEGITFKMHSKIDRVLANAKIESIPMNADAYSISACVTQALDKYAFPDERARNCVSLVCNSDFVTKGYRHEMALVITNLLSNSFTALAAIDQPLAVGDIKITIDYKPGEKHGTISFEDKGIGIATQNMPNVFDAYFTTNPKMGLGLGLAFCRSAIAKAKGKISIVSAPRQGARVLIKLPVSN